MALTIAILGAALFLAYANGANDNFKGVATLYGSGVTSFRAALTWATICTFAGSLSAAVFAERLLRLFSGKGLVPDWLVGTAPFLLAVLLGAGFTVLLTAWRGIPISTTHALVGGIVGAGLIAAGSDLNLTKLGNSFFLPLALGPLIPIFLIGLLYPIVRWLALLPLESDWIGARQHIPVLARATVWGRSLRIQENGATLQISETTITTASGTTASGTMSRTTHALHFISAGAVCFAHGLQDTPKIVGIALAAGSLNLSLSTFAVAIVMAVGGLLQARRVAETISHQITPLTPGRGTLANVVTSLLVIAASKWGLPVSFTHISVGAIMGIGVAERRVNWSVFTGIFSAWALTLPAAMILSGIFYWGLTASGLVG